MVQFEGDQGVLQPGYTGNLQGAAPAAGAPAPRRQVENILLDDPDKRPFGQ